MQLPESFDLRHRKIVSAHVQPGVKKHRTVASRENEVVASDQTRFVWVIFEGMTIKHRSHLGTAQGKPKMAGLGRLHRVHAKPASFGRGPGKRFDIQT